MLSRQFIRSFASAVKSVKPPVELYGLDGTYATALYTASAKTNALDKTYTSVAKLAETIKKDPKVSVILDNPSLSEASRAEIVSVLTEQLKLEPTVKNLLLVLAQNNRLSLFPQVATQYEILNSAANGVIDARVVSAKPLDSKIISRLQKAIAASKYVGPGKTLNVANEVDPSIIGGLIVQIGDKSVDLSVQTKVTKLNKVLGEAI